MGTTAGAGNPGVSFHRAFNALFTLYDKYDAEVTNATPPDMLDILRYLFMFLERVGYYQPEVSENEDGSVTLEWRKHRNVLRLTITLSGQWARSELWFRGDVTYGYNLTDLQVLNLLNEHREIRVRPLWAYMLMDS